MLNYMKSEWYRLTRGKEIYIMTVAMTGIVVLINLVLALSNIYIPGFRYGTFRFSLNIFTSFPFCMLLISAFIGSYLYGEDIKSGVIKNAVAYGIPRVGILLAKCIISFVFAVLMLAAVMIVYVGSAYVLLKEPEMLPLTEMLRAVLSSLPSAAASLVLMIVLKNFCTKDIMAVLWWAVAFYIIPMVCFFVGLKVELVERISEWMPYIFLNMGTFVTFSSYNSVWDTTSGMIKCILAGMIGIIICSAFGIWKIGKQEY